MLLKNHYETKYEFPNKSCENNFFKENKKKEES